MPHYLSDEELRRTAPAEVASFKSPVPIQIVSNGEFNPLPQTREQQRVEARIKELADDLGRRHGMNRRQFLASSAGMAAALLATNDAINKIAGTRRRLGHAVFSPKREGWINEGDSAISTLKPDSWKGYTNGDPLVPSKVGSTWWLDDEKLMYSFYEKIVKSGITTVCIHKGLLPVDYEKSWPGVWEYATVRDLGKAA